MEHENTQVSCADSVFVVVMNNGSYPLVGHPDGEPAAYVIADDTGPLQQGIAVAFGSTQ